MSKTIAEFKNSLTANLHGATLNKLQDPYDTINRAAGKCLLDLDFFETKRIATLENAIYDAVYDYSTPTDLKGNKIIDIRPQAGRLSSDNVEQRYSKDFDRRKADGTFNVEMNSGTKIIRIAKDLDEGTVINEANGLTNNGTWAATAGCENLAKDTLNYLSGGSSLKFDLTVTTTTGYLENSTMSEVDLTDFEDEGAIFMWVYLPDSDILTNVNLKWGTSASAYWSDTITAQHYGAFEDGWNLLRFDWNGATKTGTPDVTAINYLKVLFTYDGTADTDLRIDNIICKMGSLQQIVYYSKYLFQTSAGVWQEECSADDDVINLDTDSYNILLEMATALANQELSGEDSGFDLNVALGSYREMSARYGSTYKSEYAKPNTLYYRSPKRF